MSENLEQLREHLGRISAGPIADGHEIESLLYDCWDEFVGIDAEGMNSDKLGRTENLSWDPPCLTFEIERHGGTVLGSSRAEIHQWDLDIEEMTATMSNMASMSLKPKLKAKRGGDSAASPTLTPCRN